MRLHVSGRLSSVELTNFRNRIQEVKGRFIELDYADTIILNIDEAFINANYTQNSVAYKILSKLNEEDSEGLALQVAYDLIRQK